MLDLKSDIPNEKCNFNFKFKFLCLFKMNCCVGGVVYVILIQTITYMYVYVAKQYSNPWEVTKYQTNFPAHPYKIYIDDEEMRERKRKTEKCGI